MTSSKRAYQKTYKYLIHTPSPILLSLDIEASSRRPGTFRKWSQQYLWRHKYCWILIKLELVYQFISYFISYFLNNFLMSDYSALFYEASQYNGKILFFLVFENYSLFLFFFNMQNSGSYGKFSIPNRILYRSFQKTPSCPIILLFFVRHVNIMSN